MRNRAKCKLCSDVLESFHRGDNILCSCGEIAIGGGDHRFHCWAKNWKNFERVADDDTILSVKIMDSDAMDDAVEQESVQQMKPNKQTLLETINYFIQNMESQPQEMMCTQLTQYDLLAIYILFRSILQCDDKSPEKDK